MESYQKIFAEELNKGRTDAQNNGIRALSGRNITRCLLCGALTEVPDLEKPMAFLSLYDPTGVLVVGCHTGNPEISALLRETAFPAQTGIRHICIVFRQFCWFGQYLRGDG